MSYSKVIIIIIIVIILIIIITDYYNTSHKCVFSFTCSGTV